MKRITIQYPNGNYYQIEVTNISRRINRTTLQEEYIMEYIKDGEECFTPIINIGGQWYKNSNHDEWEDYAFLVDENLIINELPSKMLICEEKNRTPIITPSQNLLDSNKGALINLLNFIERWYPWKTDGVLQNIDTVRRCVINSSIIWSTEMLRSLIPEGTYQYELYSADLWNSNYVRTILNNILTHLMKSPQQERPHISRYPLTAPNPPNPPDPPHHDPHHREYPTYHYLHATKEPSDKFIPPQEQKPYKNKYVTFDWELIKRIERGKGNLKDVTAIYQCTKPKDQWLLTLPKETQANFSPTLASKEFYTNLGEYVKKVKKFKEFFGVWFFPPIEIEKEDYIEIYHMVPCNVRNKFLMFLKDASLIEIFYSDAYDDSFEIPLSRKVVPIEALFRGGINGIYDMQVNHPVEYFRYFHGSKGEKKSVGRHA